MASHLGQNASVLNMLAWSKGIVSDLHASVEQLFFERREEIYIYLVSLGAPPEDAQDMTQESFLKFYVALREGQRIENPRAWLYTVAHNLAMNARLRGARVFEISEVASENPESLVLASERTEQLRLAIGNLSPQQRSCLHLRAEGFRYREIAGILGINPSTVGEFLQRAVKRLRKVLYE
jgi:RNA polymerase sigma-70 factor, ECF subfamily